MEETGIQAWDQTRLISKYVEDLTDEEAALIEKRMRPGAYSESGFLDASERLREVAARDRAALDATGISPERIADRLGEMLDRASDLEWKRLNEQRAAELIKPSWARVTLRRLLYRLPFVGRWYLQRRLARLYRDPFAPVRVDHFELQSVRYMGTQECPFGGMFGFGGEGHPCSRDGTDWHIRNLRNGVTVVVSGLIVHLIRVHHFWEGETMEYRLNPTQAVKLLGL